MISSAHHLRDRWWPPGPALVVVLALATRILPSLIHGPGTLGRYDDAVYFTASQAFSWGRMPYRDFLFIHPPGIVLINAPFRLLGLVMGDAGAFLVARTAFICMGAGTAYLCYKALIPHGQRAALVAGVTCAVFPPAVYADSSVSLETIGSLTLAAALLGVLRGRRHVLAGALMALGTSTKIWLAAPTVVLAIVLIVQHKPLAAKRFAAGFVATFVAILAPFAALAPADFFRMVVQDQLGRPSAPPLTRWPRLPEMMGLTGLDGPHTPVWVSGAVALAVGAMLTWVCFRSWKSRRREVAALLALCVAVLLASPSYFLQYGALVAVPLSMAGAAASTQLSTARARRHAGFLAVGTLGFALAITASLARDPGGELPQRAYLALQGRACVTADDPGILIAADVLSKQLRLECPLWPDVTGRTYDEVGGRPNKGEPWAPRTQRPIWQDSLSEYLGSGDCFVLSRPSTGLSNEAREALAEGRESQSFNSLKTYCR